MVFGPVDYSWKKQDYDKLPDWIKKIIQVFTVILAIILVFFILLFFRLF